jgi:hypothetical protein
MRYLTLLALSLFPSTLSADDLRLNQIQVVGTHNSYHIAPAPAVKTLIRSFRNAWVDQIEYTHRPLAEQFETLGIRQIELDVFADPKGGLFAKPSGREMAKGEVGPALDPALAKPGFKVLHVQDLDYRSTVPTFAAGLAEVRAWSKAHPRHVPIMVLVELKDMAIPGLSTKPVPFDAALLDAIDAEIRTAFPAESMITPDSVRGTHRTLRHAVTTAGWPTLDAARGKVMFLLDNEGRIGELYRKGRPSLKGRAMFALCPESDGGAAIFKLNDPLVEFDSIQKLVKAGYLVRTRADADMLEARKNDGTRRDKAFASGAQFVSTDFPEARPDLSPYVVKLPGGGVARVNPVNGPMGAAAIKE